jgi:hypothetical protein
MCVSILSKTFVSNVSPSKKNSATYCHKCTWVFMYYTVLLLSDFNDTYISPTEFGEIHKYQISQIKYFTGYHQQASWVH